MKKKIQKPFNVEAAKNGAKIETRSGRPARIVCYDMEGADFPILALVNDNNVENYYSYTPEGNLFRNESAGHDLVIVEEVEATKFKVGDWVFAHHGGYPWLITAITATRYEMQDNIRGYKTHAYLAPTDYNYHLWTIDDARPGDVLICEDYNRPFIFKEFLGHAPSAYCGIDTTDSIYIGKGRPWTYGSVRPATYEERQRFFNRLEEEGYKWDDEARILWQKV